MARKQKGKRQQGAQLQPQQTLPPSLVSALPPGLEFRPSQDGRGQGIFATQHFAAGTVLLEVEPSVALLNQTNLTTTCASCWRSKDERSSSTVRSLMRCTHCKQISYCSKKCQKAHWQSHRMECEPLSKATSATSPQEEFMYRLLANIVHAKARTAEFWDEYLAQPKAEDRSKDESLFSMVRQLCQFDQANIWRYLKNGPDSLPRETALLLNHLHVVVLYSPTHLEPIGSTIVPLVSFIRHGCNPSTQVIFPHGVPPSPTSKRARLVAIHDIQPGEELTRVGYGTMPGLPRELRQERLKETIGLKQCKCQECQRQDLDPRESIDCLADPSVKHKIPATTAAAAKMACTPCRELLISGKKLEKLEQARKDVAKAESWSKARPNEALKLVLGALEAHDGFFSCSTWPYMFAHDLAGQISGRQGKFLDAVLYTSEALNGYMQIETGGDWFRAVLEGRRADYLVAYIAESLHASEPFRNATKADSEADLKTRLQSLPGALEYARESLAAANKAIELAVGAPDGGDLGAYVREMFIGLGALLQGKGYSLSG